MPRSLGQDELNAIEDAVRRLGGAASAAEIGRALPQTLPRRTLQYRLAQLVAKGRLAKEGERKWAKYRLPPLEAQGAFRAGRAKVTGLIEVGIPLSERGREIQDYVRKPLAARKPVGYSRAFLESYRPNESFYLTQDERARLAGIGKPDFSAQPAGTYARKILERLLIDLSWSSSRLEGNTYSLLDTKRLIEEGAEAEGHSRREAQMILNHKDAIEFLVGTADEIGFNRYSILNLHALLANNLLDNPEAAGRLRRISVGIEQSTYHPPEAPQLIEECFDLLLAKAAAIEDPFEQAFFAMVQLPYLQPFDDVNKRVSRLAANIPFIKANLSPLSFLDVPRDTYIDGLIGVYELNEADLLRDVFVWAYERSAARYAAVRQSLGEPDPLRLKHRDFMREVVGEVVRGRMDQKSAAAHIRARVLQAIAPAEQERVQELAERELLSLHEGNCARHGIRPAEFAAWQEAWAGSKARTRPHTRRA